MEKPRYIALTDISTGIEVDDRQSLIRLLLYSNEIQIEGLIAVTSCFLKNGAKKHNENIIHKIINEYGKVRHNLLAHKNDHPTSEYLDSVTFCGIDKYGKAYGNGFCEEKYNDNAGVRQIIKAADKSETPLFIGLWGGANTLAQAVWTAEREKSEADFKSFLSKLRVYSISDQDSAGKWLRDTYGDRLYYVVSPSRPDRSGSREYYKATWPGISADRNGHGSENGKDRTGGFSGADYETVSNRWIKNNIIKISSYGKLYPKTRFITEGDTPAFLGLISNGLNAPGNIEYGGWGGRYVLQKIDGEKHRIYSNSSDTVYGVDGEFHTSPQATVWRWREDFQNDFAGRMLWTSTDDFNSVNHNPVLRSEQTVVFAKPNEKVKLSVKSYDENASGMVFSWIHYPEAADNDFYIDLSGEKSSEIEITVPSKAESDIHIIFRATNGGPPPMSSYLRFIIKIKQEMLV
ncbi:MAG: DUF1593 domain-containing protein [Clostridia bacterium]|nr:DUF1593 domain-containing protein [Clostridia bacterium]